jgi:hypothetical protein
VAGMSPSSTPQDGHLNLTAVPVSFSKFSMEIPVLFPFLKNTGASIRRPSKVNPYDRVYGADF